MPGTFNRTADTETVNCPSCGHTEASRVETRGGRALPQLFQCLLCGAVHGGGWLGDVLEVVRLGTLREDTVSGESLSFNVTTLGSDGVQHHHGWFDPQDGVVHQIG